MLMKGPMRGAIVVPMVCRRAVAVSARWTCPCGASGLVRSGAVVVMMMMVVTMVAIAVDLELWAVSAVDGGCSVLGVSVPWSLVLLVVMCVVAVVAKSLEVRGATMVMVVPIGSEPLRVRAMCSGLCTGWAW